MTARRALGLVLLPAVHWLDARIFCHRSPRLWLCHACVQLDAWSCGW